MSRLTKKFEDNSGYTPVVNHPVRKEITLYDFEEQDYDCCVEKLGKLEDLEEEIGCPFEVVIKGLKEGIVLENGKLYHCSLSFHKRQKYSNEDYILICYENGESVVGVSVKQYKKTWWLKGENNEKN